ncbi:MAG: leucine-rich repeat protein, partial [Clostridia bacterium]|nr:leucine-rich repeat protein [Clostridia bacterium]
VSLGGGAFKNCTSLKEIFIPKSLENVGVFYYYTAHGPFDGCVNLNVIEFEDDITKIPDQLFNSCEGLLSVTIPNSVVEIGDSSFAQCNNLTSVSIPESVVTIANYAFAECVSLSSVSLPSHLEYLGNASFLNCASIVRIDIPMPIECIRDDTFSGCLLLEKITLTNNVREIKSFAFRNCQSLVEIEIPKDVTYIAKEAFYGCSTLTKINIHENIINIGESAFENCTSLQQVSMTNSVTEIGNTAFKGCTALTNIELSSKLTTINDSLFADCSSLEEIVIPKGVTKINKNAFLNCVSLKKITIPVTVTSIDSTSLSYPDRTVIYGCVGSYAETYANEYGFEFVDITKHITGLILKDNDEEKITIDRGYYVTPEFEYLPADTTDVITLTSNDTSIVTVDGSRLYGKNNGSATVTATTTGGLEYTFDVYVHTLNSISVSSQPIKTSYKHGEELDLTGLGITASYGDGTSNTITEYTVSGYDPNVYGAQTVTISYNDKEVTFTVEVIDDRTKLTSIAITTLPSKVAYNKGESFDPTGMVVTGYYSDGTSAPVTGYTVSAMNSLKTGTQTLTVTYEEFTATFTVTVGMATVTLSSVSIKTLPNKVVYIVGESFDTSGLILVANYSDGSTKEVSSGYSVGGFSSSSVGTKTITVTYEGKSTTFNVTVKENEPVVKDVYTITFNSNGGSAVNPITAEEGSQISAPTNPTKTGYTFAGWTDVNGESVSVPSTMPSYNTTLYAKWAVNSYTVTWIVDDETTEENYKFGATINEPAEPAKEGYKFVDWTPAIPDTMPAYGLTFTAVFDVLPNEPDFNKACPDCGESFNNEDEYNRHVSEHGGDENEEDFEFEIRTPSIATVNYGDSLMLHADVTGTLPEDFYIGWSTNNEHFTVDISGKGSVCTISPASSGETEFTATVYDKDGNVVCSDTQKVASKAGFFHKIIAFFKGLFGLTKDYEW